MGGSRTPTISRRYLARLTFTFRKAWIAELRSTRCSRYMSTHARGLVFACVCAIGSMERVRHRYDGRIFYQNMQGENLVQKTRKKKTIVFATVFNLFVAKRALPAINCRVSHPKRETINTPPNRYCIEIRCPLPSPHLPHSDGVDRRLDVVHAVADGESFGFEPDRASIWGGGTRGVDVHVHRFRRRLVVQVQELCPFEWLVVGPFGPPIRKNRSDGIDARNR